MECYLSFQAEIPEVSSIYDMDPGMAIITRRTQLENAYINKYMVFGYHFEFTGIGEIIKLNNLYFKYNKLSQSF